jgi:hypothetical protein
MDEKIASFTQNAVLDAKNIILDIGSQDKRQFVCRKLVFTSI